MRVSARVGEVGSPVASLVSGSAPPDTAEREPAHWAASRRARAARANRSIALVAVDGALCHHLGFRAVAGKAHEFGAVKRCVVGVSWVIGAYGEGVDPFGQGEGRGQLTSAGKQP